MDAVKSQDLKDMSQAIDVRIPDSTEMVKMHRFYTWENGTSLARVNFPAGWSRPIVGSYLCAEEFFIFEGELQMSGETFLPNDHIWVPPQSLRVGTFSPQGAVTMAWFYGKPVWVRQENNEGTVDQIKTHIDAGTAGEVRKNNANNILGRTMKFPRSEFESAQEYEVVDLIARTWNLYAADSKITLSGQELVRLSK
jgi:hypothetical protein